MMLKNNTDVNPEVEHVQFLIKHTYPRDLNYDIETYLERINLDEECKTDLETGRGFEIKQVGEIKKDLKNPEGIFSQRFGQTLQDSNAFADRYKCECGFLKGKIHDGMMCKICGSKVRFIDDDFSLFGWIRIDEPYAIIHPNLYKSLAFLIGSVRLDNIINCIIKMDKNGHPIPNEPTKEEPYKGIGMMTFMEKFDEILNFYYTKSPNKKEYYDDIISNKEKIFIHSIPVFTTLLRPYRIDGDKLCYGDVNNHYNMMAKLSIEINRTGLRMWRKKKPKSELLYNMQVKLNLLYKEIEEILSGKKGYVRTLFGGRYSFTARAVIVPDTSLGVDQISLSYHILVELLQQRIINILQKTYNITYGRAYDMWYKAYLEVENIVVSIIQTIINDAKDGIPVLINRN